MTITDQLTSEDLYILCHSLGISEQHRKPYRNYYAADPSDMRLERLVDLGMMLRGQRIPGGLVYYHVTDSGIEAAKDSLPPTKKLTRSQQRYRKFIEVGDGFDSFKHFLQYESAKKRKGNGE